MISKMVKIFVCLELVFVQFFYITDGIPLPRNAEIPANWKDLLTPEVYAYHLTKDHSDHGFEGDITGIDKKTSSQMLCQHSGLKLTSQCPETLLQGSGGNNRQSVLRTAIVDKNLRWPDGVVPYEISSSFTSREQQVIKEALADMMRKTCVRFVPYVGQDDYVSFVRRGFGCSSYIARVGGKQLIDLQQGCIYKIGEVQHEVMHALGFFHEQSRGDRDQFVTIIWSNIIAGAEDQFKKYRTDSLNMPYDYESIMHYGWNYYAKDKSRPTILPKVKSALGTREVMSRSDVEKINRLYECPRKDVPPLIPTKPLTTTGPRHHHRPTTRRTTHHHHHHHYDHHHRRPTASTTAPRSSWQDFKQSARKDQFRTELE